MPLLPCVCAPLPSRGELLLPHSWLLCFPVAVRQRAQPCAPSDGFLRDPQRTGRGAGQRGERSTVFNSTSVSRQLICNKKPPTSQWCFAAASGCFIAVGDHRREPRSLLVPTGSGLLIHHWIWRKGRRGQMQMVVEDVGGC